LSLLLDIFGYLSVLLRGLVLTAQSIVFGSLAFLLLLLRPLASSLSADSRTIAARCQTVLRISAFAFAVLTLCAMFLNAAALVGTVEVSWGAALTAGFARAGFVTAGCALTISILSKEKWDRINFALLVTLAAIILVAQLTTTHAASRLDLRWPFIIADALHMVGAAVWIGGLPCFLISLSQCDNGLDWRLIGRRYSLMSMSSVAAILIGGIVMSFGYIGSFEALYGTAYGVMTLTKVALFLLLLMLGAGNFFTVDALRRDTATPILRLKRFAEAEIGIGITVLFAAASLTSLPPGADLLEDRASWQEIVERTKPQFPIRLASPDHDKLYIPMLQAKIAAAEAQKTAAPRAYIPGEGIIPPRNAEDVAWSEYNHHWAGVFVLLIGLLAIIEHFRWGRFARHWPLLFLGMAAFLFVRSDPEAWPMGEIGFMESMRDPEVAQHRIFVLLIILFGLFEWKVRLNGRKDSKAALVFPLTTAIGGAMLLTHSHAIANAKEEMLIEISHVSIAIFGVIGGWARWLELRLDGTPSRIASWIWPLAFIAVGLLLLDYREA